MNLPIAIDLNLIWFILVGILFTGYVMLDGFDLGVGALHLFTRTDQDRRIMLNSIGPVWDGNEVWLVTGGGALFAAFPMVYATVFSGFYLAFMLLLFTLIFRAVSIEFRSKQPMRWWRQTWDVAFSLSSITSALLIGVAMGNIARGIQLGPPPDHEYLGGFFDLLNPYALMMGITTVALFTMHGAIYTVLKTEGAMHEKARAWINNAIIFFVICYVTITMATLIYLPHMTVAMKAYPIFFAVPVLNMLAIANIPRAIYHGKDMYAFFSSCMAMLALMTLLGLGMFPNMVLSNPLLENSLTIYNAASSDKTLSIMLTIAILGMPLVLAYTISIYWVFRGKVHLDSSSY